MVGQPYNPSNCAFVSNQALNANQFGNAPYSSNNTNHLVLWDFVEKKLLWVNSATNVIESEVGGANLPTNVGNLSINPNSLPESSLVREYYDGDLVKYPLETITGTTNETIVGSVFIPANTYKVGDVVKKGIVTLSYAQKINSGLNNNINFYANATNSLIGATLINNIQNSNSGGYLTVSTGYNAAAPIDPDFAKFISITNLVGGNIDNSVNPMVYQSSYTTFDITSDAYVIVTTTLADSNDFFTLRSLFLNKVINPRNLV